MIHQSLPWYVKATLTLHIPIMEVECVKLVYTRGDKWRCQTVDSIPVAKLDMSTAHKRFLKQEVEEDVINHLKSLESAL